MTGTPINNNIREIFNLMNFLDPPQWNDLNALEKQFETLSPELLDVLHEKLRPYFLRRTKAEVMRELPRKVRDSVSSKSLYLLPVCTSNTA